MKKFFKKLHLWLSVPFGIVITLICFSGATLVFEDDITEALNPQIYKVEAKAGAQPMKPSEIVKRVKAQVPDTLVLSSISIPAAKDEPYMVGFDNVRRRQLSVNQYTGEVQGWTPQYPFFRTMLKLHRWLLDPPEKKGAGSVGKYVVGVSTLMFVFVLVSGVVIWWPRRSKQLKDRLTFPLNKGWWRLWYGSHLALGIYATVFLLLMALTGLTWSFGWYRTAAYSLFGADMGKGKKDMPKGMDGKAGGHGRKDGRNHKEGGKPSGQGHDGEEKPAVNTLAWDNALAQLESKYASFASIQLKADEATVIKSNGGVTRKSDNAKFDPSNGAIEKVETSDKAPRQRVLKGAFYSFHTGRWGGLFTQILYFLSALIGALLPVTGYYLWIKRITRKRRR